ncbi:FkbM family methyltransferase [Selenomonas sp.]|uniref:FkbM family methyltransferase n=1 Tax=Selenomonas sp. TaxID=2053611 RepID=UPI0025E4B71E|nr:FkbM family methyltransferase [Selenomonas sp.]
MFESIYETMRGCEYPIYIWGNGSMAHVVYKKMQEQAVLVQGYFVNVSTCWQEQHRDVLPRLTLQELREQNKPFAVVMGHGHIELMSQIQQEELVKEVFIIPNPYDYYIPEQNVVRQALADGIDAVRSYLVDKESQDNLLAYFTVHTENYRDFYQKVKMLDGLFYPDIWQFREDEVYYDIGAWNGDTVREFLAANNKKYKSIEAFEPDPVASMELIRSVEGKDSIHCHRIGLASTPGKMQIQGSGTQSAFIEKTEMGNIPVYRLDDVVEKNGTPTLIKIGVPKLTLDILQGAKLTIQKNKPRLIISVAWGTSNDLLDTIKWVKQINPEYKLALRYRLLMPTQLWLYAY